MYLKNTSGQFVCFQGVDATTGGIKSGVTWTVRRCIDGTFAAGGGTVTEDSTNGWYKYAMAQADSNGNDISFNFTGTGAVPQTVNITTVDAPSATIAKSVWEDHVTLGTGTGAGGDFDVSGTIGYTLYNFLSTGVVAASLGSQAKTDVASAVWRDNTTGGDFGVAGSVGLLVVTDLDTNIGSRLASTSYTAPLNLTAAQIATGVWEDHVIGTGTGAGGDFDVLNTIGYQLANFLGIAPTTTGIASAVWDLRTTGHTSSTTFGAAVVAAGSAGDPWTTSLPGAYGAGTAGFIVGTNLDTTVSSRLATSGYTAPPSAASIASAVWTDHTTAGTGTGAGGDFDVANTIGYTLYNYLNVYPTAQGITNAVWNEQLSGHSTTGSAGKTLSSAGSAGDPWSTVLPGSYTSGQAGFIVGTNLDTTVSSRLASVSYTTPPTASQIATAVWTDHIVGTGTGAGGDFDVTASIGYRLANYTGAAQTALAIDPTGAPLATAASLSTVSTTIGTPANVTIAADIASVKTDTGTTLPALLPSSPVKNTAFTYVIKMVLTSDHVTPATGLTVAMTRSLDGAAFASATGTVTEISTGHYKVAASAADMNGDFVAHRFTAGTADDLTVEMVTVS